MIDSTSYQNGLLTPSYCFLASGKVVAKFCAKYLTEKFSIVKPMQLVTWVLLSTELTSGIIASFILACLPFHHFIANLEQMM